MMHFEDEEVVTHHSIDEKLRTSVQEMLHGKENRRQVGGSHYQLPIQPVDYIVMNELGYLEGNVIKYVTRHKQKAGREDLMKAKHYIDMILEYEYGVNND